MNYKFFIPVTVWAGHEDDSAIVKGQNILTGVCVSYLLVVVYPGSGLSFLKDPGLQRPSNQRQSKAFLDFSNKNIIIISDNGDDLSISLLGS